MHQDSGAKGPMGPSTSDMAGPWGQDPDGPGDGKGGGDAPSGKRGSPWLPDGDGAEPAGRGPGSGRRGPNFDDLLKRGPFGPKLPGMPTDRRVWLWGALGIALLWLGFTVMHRLEPEEDGVITRFGAYSRTVGPGIQWTLPFPIERLERVASRRIQTENIPDGTTPNLVLTGDANIINLAYSVRWKVNRPELFVFQLDGPRATIRAAAETAMRATMANFTLSQAIGSGRTEIEIQVQQRMQSILNQYGAGVTVDGVSIRDSAPPTEVEDAFNEVNVAQQRAEGSINEARAYAAQVTSQAEGAAAEFDRIYEQYRQAPEVTRRRIYYETMEQIMTRSEKTIIGSGNAIPYLPLPPVTRAAPAAPAVEARAQP